jgi:peptide-methionine (S)-S-oxide reductase
VAEDLIRELNAGRTWSDPIVTAVKPASEFYKAEDYHQNYFQQHSRQPYCAFVVGPKVKKFREKFASKLRSA